MLACGFCGRPENETQILIKGLGSEVGIEGADTICDRCFNKFAVDHNTARLAEFLGEDKPKRPISNPRQIAAHLDRYVVSQTAAKQDVSVASYDHYKRREIGHVPDGVEIQKSNLLITGPTGTGKTQIARALAKLLDVPFHVADATKLTQVGYVGDDVESLLLGLLQAADGDVEAAQWGIICIDEFDKLARKSGREAAGFRDVSGEGVQQSLLKLVEGTRVTLQINETGSDRFVTLDTTNILFIAAGSFAGMEEVVRRRINHEARIGFGGASHREVGLGEVYTSITEDDILEFGLIPELVGRFPVLTTTLPLSEEDLYKILTEPADALIKQKQALFSFDGVDLTFDEGALRTIANMASKRPTGARGLRSIVEATLKPYRFELGGDATVRGIHISADVVNGSTRARITQREPDYAATG